MNPGWLLAGLAIGHRASPFIRDYGTRVLRQAQYVTRKRGRDEYRRWVASLPVKDKA